MALVCLVAGIATAATVTQSITYQGKLTNAAGSPLTGAYSVTFILYDAVTGGTALSTDTHSVTATNGLFTTPITFSQDFYNGRALWLGIKVGSDPEMTPRQEIQPVPYALSLRPGSWITSSGGSSVLNLQNTGGGIGLNVLTSGTNSRAVIASTTGLYGNGVSASTSGQYSNGVSASTSGTGSHGLSASTSGTDSYGVNVRTTNTSSHGVYVSTTGSSSTGIVAYTSGSSSTGVVASTHGTNSGGVVAVTYGDNSEGVFAWTEGDESPAVRAVAKGPHSNAVWGSTSADGPAAVAGTATGIYSYGVYATSEQSHGLYADTGRSDQKYGIYTPDYLYAKGTQVPTADVAEYMPVAENVTPGTVLVIGDDGKLQPSTIAYDTRVAGIVSTTPGVTLGIKENGNPGEQIIAVAGRVPCKVDAGSAPIHAGDLLTTSDNPGYAMKATNPQIGTVLGKAMGTLESGTGTIEVLVTLQ